MVVAVLTLLAVATGCDGEADAGPAPRTSERPPAEPPADPTAPEPTGTLFGANVYQAPGESAEAALARVDTTFGPLQVVRLFSEGLPPDWASVTELVGDRPVVVSFKADPTQVVTGAFDEQLSAWFASAPTDRDTYWAYFHEPEDDVERGSFTAAEFVRAWTHVAGLAEQAGNDWLRPTVVLMCWTVDTDSGRDWHDFAPPAGSVDVLAFDCYAHGATAETYVNPYELVAPAFKAARELGADWAIAETGARVADPLADGAGRAGWLSALGAIARNNDARFVTYFDSPTGGDFQLRDPESVAAWSRLVQG